ncbi:MAG: amidase [Alphaproteobacteria bacterium]|nr:amidase [Alphaproteobacteria bacterium]
MTLWQLPACEAADKIRSGEISSADLVEACLDRIAATDSDIGAFTHLDRETALSDAAAMDRIRRRGRALGELHGIPLALAEVFDTQSIPSGTPIAPDAKRTPNTDAAVMDRLREAGAIRIGKTSSNELDASHVAAVRNPHAADRSAGTAASGSAAAVAAGHVPLALCVQSNGSLINSASYCGIFGFKPTRGMISRRGCFLTSPSLDQIGVLGRSLQDVATLTDAIAAYDPSDDSSFPRPRPRTLEGYRSEPPVEPCFAWIELPFLEAAPESTRHGFEEVMETLGDRIEKIPAPKSFTEIGHHHQVVQSYELLRSIDRQPALEPDQINPSLRAILESAKSLTEKDYNLALAMMAGAEEFFASFFHDFDAIIAPSALGEAPILGATISDAACSAIWTFAGLPCLSAPWLRGESGLPVGVQLIGSAEEDDRLFRTAGWLERHLQDAA